MHLGDVVDQFHDENRLAHACPAEQADLAALGVGGQEIDHLDAGHKDLGLGRLLAEFRCGLVDRAEFFRLDRAALVHGLAHDVQDAPQRRGTHGNHDRATGVGDFLATHEAFGGVHRDGAHSAFAQVLGNFEHKTLAAIVGVERVQDLGQVIVELNVDNSADDLGDFSDCICHVVSPVLRALRRPR